MAPASLDLSLDEVIQASKGDKGSGKGGKRNAPAKEEEPVSLDMSLDELIEKDYLPPKGKGGKGGAAWRDDDWVPKKSGWESQSWTEKTKASTGGGGGVAAWKGWKESSGGGAGGGWKDKRSDTWGNDSWKAATPVAWKPKAETSWSSSTEKWGAGTKKDWSAGNNKSWDDDWKPKPRGDDWSSKASWTPRESGKGSWDRDSWNPTPWSKPAAWDTPQAPAWRPTNEQEREERWNRGNDDRWERREDLRDRGYASRRDGGYGGESYDVRDRRGRNERSRTPPRRNYFDDVPRGNVILVKNIPMGLDSRDIRDAFQSATGTVTSCKMGPDGTARISFERPEDAKKAVATFDNGELNGRIIRVTITG